MHWNVQVGVPVDDVADKCCVVCVVDVKLARILELQLIKKYKLGKLLLCEYYECTCVLEIT